jgi:hypothetical protein
MLLLVRKTRNLKKIPSLEVPNGSPKKVSPVESPRDDGTNNNNGPDNTGHLPGYYTNRELLVDTKEELEDSPSSSPASSYSFNSLRSSANTTLKAAKSSEITSPRLEALKPRRLRRGTESRLNAFL